MWYYANGDQEIGPVSADELKALTVNGTVGPQTLVWKEGMPDWKLASQIRGLLPDGSGGPPRPVAPVGQANNPYRATSVPTRSPYPQNGTLILILGICSFAVCGLLAIPAWVMGNTYMAECRRRNIEPETTAVVGRIIGIVSCALMALSAVFGVIFILFAAANG